MTSLPPNQPAADGIEGDRFVGSADMSLRTRAARGSLVNAGFLAAINVLGFAKYVIVAALLGASEFGIWGLLAVSLGTLLWIAAVGVDDKYIQQDHPDQRAAFEVAFTIQCLLCGALMALIAVAIPLFALAYDQPAIIAPGLALALAMPAAALQTPLWVFYRRMDFVKQRSLQFWDPAVSFFVTTGLAIAGLGVWSLVIGTLAGAWSAAAAAALASPYRLRFRWEHGAVREYATFSWPLFIGSASAVLVAQVPALVASRHLGLAAVGAITLATNIALFTRRVDEVVTQALYPAICAIKDRREQLFESFSKSNRLALLWGVPTGVAAALFANDFVRYVLGEDKWHGAVPLIQAFGLIAAADQIAFNWTAYFRARGRTRPIGVANAVLLAGVLAVAVPLMISGGLTGFAIGMAIATALAIAVRLWFVTRIFPALRVAGHVGRAILPTVPGVLVVLAARALTSGGDTAAEAVAELAAFVLVTVAATLVIERSLVREAAGYLRRRPAPGVAPAAV